MMMMMMKMIIIIIIIIMRMINNIKKIFLIFSIASYFVINAEAKNGGTTDGAFTTLMLSTIDVNRYVETLKSNTAAFKATGATDAGICITRSGNEYDGQMMVWSAFTSLRSPHREEQHKS